MEPERIHKGAEVKAASLEQQFQKATRLHQQGDHEQAGRLYRRILAHFPQHPEALRLLAVIHLQQGDPAKAVPLLEAALNTHPNPVTVWINLASAERQRGRPEIARNWLESVLSMDSKHAQAWSNLGHVHREMAELDSARDAYLKALSIQPSDEVARYNLGLVLKNLGEVDAAIDCFRQLISKRPDHHMAWYSLADLKTYRFSPDELEQVGEIIEGTDLDADRALHLCFAAAKAADDQGEHSRSFDYLARANALKYKQLNPPSVDRTRLAEQIGSVFSQPFIESCQQHQVQDDSAIFIISMPRSGSTLIEQILASHSRVTGAAELPTMGQLVRQACRSHDGAYPDAMASMRPEDFARIGDAYLEATAQWHKDTPHFTDKMPNNFAWAGAIAASLPGARLIEARRHPLDICLSCYRQNFSVGNAHTFDLEALAEFYIYYHRVMTHWHRVLGDRLIAVQYEALVNDPDTEIRALLAHCRLEYEPACAAFHKTRRSIRTASAAQVSQRLNRSGLGRWKPYEQQLAPLIERLEAAGIDLSRQDPGH